MKNESSTFKGPPISHHTMNAIQGNLKEEDNIHRSQENLEEDTSLRHEEIDKNQVPYGFMNYNQNL